MTPLVGLVACLIAGGGLTLWTEPAFGVLPVALVLGPGLLLVSTRFAWAGFGRHALILALAGSALCGVAQARLAALRAWQPPRVDVDELEARSTGVALVIVEGVLRHDASPSLSGASLDLRVDRIEIGAEAGVIHSISTDMGVRLTVAGEMVETHRADWTRGRRVRTPVSTLRRPLPYRNFDVPDAERELARRGIRMFGSVKSASLVEWSRGPWWEEAAAAVRARVRSAVRTAIDAPAAQAVVIAILIGDRTGLDPDEERRMQHAGVYHVIAISGGNVALFLGAIAWLPRWHRASVRVGTAIVALALLVFAHCVDGGASVARASLVAGAWLAARWWDLRTTALQAMTVAAGLIVMLDPLALHDPGFVLSFGATLALVVLSLRIRIDRPVPERRPAALRVARAVAMVVVATASVELVLLPIAARWFSLVTGVGLLANLAALPAMAVVQGAGMACTVLWWIGLDQLAGWAGVVATAGVEVLLACGLLVDALPVLVREVPPPSLTLVLGYFAALAVALWGSWPISDDSPHEWQRPTRPVVVLRRYPRLAGGLLRVWATGVLGVERRRLRQMATALGGGSAGLLLVLIVWGGPDVAEARPWTWELEADVQTATWPADEWLVVTFLDVAQGDATLVRFPNGRTWLVDAGGTVVESTFDVGARVTTPALWALGHRRIDRAVLTHGHADHGGGLPAVFRRFRPRELLVGVPVPEDPVDGRVLAHAEAHGTRVRRVRAGERFVEGAVNVRVLHPPEPDWVRVKVRNDDSVVLWVRYGQVGIVLPGDTGREVENEWATGLVAAPLTVLKAGHHGSATSTSRTLLQAFPPDVVIVSAGRGNRFGHPHPDVVRRAEAVGARIYRTDTDGAVQLATNGHVLAIRTAGGRREVVFPRAKGEGGTHQP